MSNGIDSNRDDRTTQESTHNRLITDQLRASLAKPGTYVLDCRTMNDNDWRQLYPPIASELRSLPGSGLPFWHYEWNYCVWCQNTLRNCRSNPFGFYGSLQRRSEKTQDGADRSVDHRQESKTDDGIVPSDAQEPRLPATSNTRPAAPIYERTIPRELEAVIAGDYEKRETIRSISEHHRIAAPVVREFLAQAGILRKPGDHLKRPGPVAAMEEIEPSESLQPPKLPEKGRTGKPHTTLLLDEILVSDVAAMIAKGEGGGLVAIAKAKNLNIKELSAALKARGIVLRSGKKNVRTDETQAPDAHPHEQNANRLPAKRKERLVMPSLFDQAF